MLMTGQLADIVAAGHEQPLQADLSCENMTKRIAGIGFKRQVSSEMGIA
jgi:hypothetical protein